MFLEHQISMIFEDHVTLKTGVMAAESKVDFFQKLPQTLVYVLMDTLVIIWYHIDRSVFN